MDNNTQWSPIVRRVADDFDAIAARYAPAEAASSVLYPYVLDSLPIHCGSVLEIGSGMGTLSRLLSGRADRVVGIDVSTRMIDLASQSNADLPNVEYVLHDAEDLGQLDCGSTFDAVVTAYTLHHCDLDAVLSGVKALLSPGGVLCILDMVVTRYLPTGLNMWHEAVRYDLAHPWHFLRTAMEVGLPRLWNMYSLNRRMYANDLWTPHQHADFAQGRAYGLDVFQDALDRHFPGGVLRVLCGAAFVYRWEDRHREGRADTSDPE